MRKRMKSKREQEEERKKADEEAAAKAYEDFYNTFVDVPDQKSKVWVKAGTFDAGSRKEDTREKGKLYKPTSKLEELRDKFSSAEKAAQHASRGSDRPDRPGKKREREKKKSNLELFKEELKLIQEERAERHRVKNVFHREPVKSRFEASEPKPTPNEVPQSAEDSSKSGGSYDSGDPTTTNLYLGNLSPKITEQRLMELFGRYGPLASIKIMWPRTDDERSRGRNCGFVAYMNRKDGERALAGLIGRDIEGFEMKLGWGKSVPIPPHPIYIPPALIELTLPPPPSGLPFNCQPCKKDVDKISPMGMPPPNDHEKVEETNKILQKAVVKVVIPTESCQMPLHYSFGFEHSAGQLERSLLQLIHRMIEFVVREGPMFEAMVMNKELNNPDFRFLFENQSPAHVYYRWKLYTMLQGDSQNRWSTKPFRLFKGSSIWKPPPLNPFLQGMPEELIKKEEEFDERSRKGSLSNAQRKRLESMIRTLTPEREKVGEVMVWCIEHAEAADEICQCLTEALTNLGTNFPKKVARLYLVSDILHNCSVKVTNASFFRKYFQAKLMEIVEGLHSTYSKIESRIRAEQAKQRVMKCFRAWEDWTVYPHDFLIKLQNIFIGIGKKDDDDDDDDVIVKPERRSADDMDGIPIDDVDGFPLGDASSGASQRGGKEAPLIASSAAISALQGYDDDYEEEEDIDGAPFEEDIDGTPLAESPKQPSAVPGFAPSKWESVSPKRVESQAMTLSKWDELEGNKSGGDDSNSDTTPVYNRPGKGKKSQNYEEDEDLDGIPIDYDVYKQRSPSSSEDDDRSHRQDRDSDSEDSRGLDRLQGDSEERRAKLRAVEVKVLQYQDELERGMRTLKEGYSLHRQIQHYRHKLLKKIMREEGGSSERRQRKRRSRSFSPEDRRARKTSRSRSPHKSHHRGRSRSPRRYHSRSPRKRRSTSRSPSRKHKKKRH